MPTPSPRESKPHFIKRAIQIFMKEGDPKDQAIAKAYSFWAQYRKKPPK